MTAETSARLQVLGGAVLFSTAGAAVKSCALTGWQVAGVRSLIATGIILAVLPASRRRGSPRILLVAAAHAATLVLFILANKLTTAATTIFLQNTAPLYVVLLGAWLLGERLRPRDLLFMAVLAVGMTLFFVDPPPPAATAPDPLLGGLLAGFSGLTMALTLIGLRWLSREEDGSAASSVVFGNLMVFAVSIPFWIPWPEVGWTDWALAGYLGVFQLGLAYALVTTAVARLPAFEVSLLILLEPVLNPVWAWLVHGEAPGALALAGGGVIVAAISWRAISWRALR